MASEIQAILKIRDDLSAQIQKTNKNLKELNREVKKSQKELEKVSKNTSFKNLTKSIFTAQLAMKAFVVAARGVSSAFRASAEFETSMTKLITLVGVSRDEVKDLEESVKDLAGETAQSPRQLAESLFFIESAGLRGKEAMDALELSAKAAAIGMGDQKDIADALTSAMNAYGPSVLTAQQATDTMLAAVRAGKMEPRELAGALGQVLPVAAEMGVTFQEVNAALASLSKTGTSVTQGVTQIRSVMTAFLKPGEAAAKILGEYGLSAAKIREQIREKGLIETLISLREKFKGNEEELAKVIGRVEGFNAVLALTGDHAQDTRDVLEQTNNSLGLIDEGFKEVSDTASHQFNQSMAELEKIGIELATNVLPPLVALLKEFNAILKSVSPQTKEWAIQMGLLAIALAKVAPLLTKIGGLKLAKGALAAGAGGPAAIIAGALIVATLLETKLKDLASVQERMAKRDKGFVGTIIPGKEDQEGVIDFLKNFTIEAEKVEPAAASAAKGFNQFANIPIMGAAAESIIPDDLLGDISDQMKVSQKIIDEYVPKLSEIGHEYGVITIAGRPYVDVLMGTKKGTEEASDSVDEFARSLQEAANFTIVFGQTLGSVFGGLSSSIGGFQKLFGKAEGGFGFGGLADKFKKDGKLSFGSFLSGMSSALPAIGALVGPIIGLFSKLFKPAWKKVAEESSKIFGKALSEGLSKELVKVANQLGSTQNAFAARIGDVIAEVGINAGNAREVLASFGNLLGMVENGTLDWAAATEQVNKAFAPIVDHLHEMGMEGSVQIGALVSRMRELGQVSSEVQSFIKEKAESAISNLGKFFEYLSEQEELTGEQAAGALTQMSGAFQAAIQSSGSLVGAINMLGEGFGTLLGKLRDTVGENNILLNTMTQYYNFVQNNSEQLAAIDALSKGFKDLVELGIVNSANISDFAASFKTEFESMLAATNDQSTALAAMGPQLGQLLEAYQAMGLQVPGWLVDMAEKAKEAGASLAPPEGLPDILKDIRDIMLSIAEAMGAASKGAKDFGKALGDINGPKGVGANYGFDSAQSGMFKKLKKDTLILAHAGEYAAIVPEGMNFVSAQGGYYDGTKAEQIEEAGLPGYLPTSFIAAATTKAATTVVSGGAPAATLEEIQQTMAAAVKEIVAAAKPEINLESSPVIQLQLPEMTAAKAQEIAQEIIIPETKRALRMNTQGLRDEIQEIAKHG